MTLHLPALNCMPHLSVLSLVGGLSFIWLFMLKEKRKFLTYIFYWKFEPKRASVSAVGEIQESTLRLTLRYVNRNPIDGSIFSSFVDQEQIFHLYILVLDCEENVRKRKKLSLFNVNKCKWSLRKKWLMKRVTYVE
jgi:hypothetical protein